jgi:hypothetical protein
MSWTTLPNKFNCDGVEVGLESLSGEIISQQKHSQTCADTYYTTTTTKLKIKSKTNDTDSIEFDGDISASTGHHALIVRKKDKPGFVSISVPQDNLYINNISYYGLHDAIDRLKSSKARWMMLLVALLVAMLAIYSTVSNNVRNYQNTLASVEKYYYDRKAASVGDELNIGGGEYLVPGTITTRKVIKSTSTRLKKSGEEPTFNNSLTDIQRATLQTVLDYYVESGVEYSFVEDLSSPDKRTKMMLYVLTAAIIIPVLIGLSTIIIIKKFLALWVLRKRSKAINEQLRLFVDKLHADFCLQH